MPRHLLAAALIAFTTVPAVAADPPVVALVKSKVKDPDKPFVLLVLIKAKEGAGDKLEAAVAECRAATRKEKGNKLYELTRYADEPRLYLLYERFDSAAALAEHIALPHTQKLLAAFPDLIDGSPDLKVLVPVAE